MHSTLSINPPFRCSSARMSGDRGAACEEGAMIVQRSSCSDPRFSYDFETTAEICDNAGFQRLFFDTVKRQQMRKICCRFGSVFEIIADLFAAARMTELAQRLCLNLTDAFARDIERLADILECFGRLIIETVAHAEHIRLTRRQG